MMCMSNMKPYALEKTIEVFKVVLRLEDGSLVSIICYCQDNLENYTYKLGTNTKTVDTTGIHTYESRDSAIEFARVIAKWRRINKNNDGENKVESVCVLSAYISADVEVEKGDWYGHTGYVSDSIVTDATPIKEYLWEPDFKTFYKRALDIGMMGDR